MKFMFLMSKLQLITKSIKVYAGTFNIFFIKCSSTYLDLFLFLLFFFSLAFCNFSCNFCLNSASRSLCNGVAYSCSVSLLVLLTSSTISLLGSTWRQWHKYDVVIMLQHNLFLHGQF